MTVKHLPTLTLALTLLMPLSAAAQDEESWLPTLMTETPQEGFELAVTLARKGVTTTQPDKEVLHSLRPIYSKDADSLTAASHVIAVHFQTIAQANDYWRLK